MPSESKKEDKAAEENNPRGGNGSFHIVAVGASAGGLEALEVLFEQMPVDIGAAFVVVQHLSPDHKSHTPELLAEKTEIPVMEAEEGMTLEPNVIYVKPAGNMLSITAGAFQLIDPQEVKNRHLPIDLFFEDLADDQGEKAIAVILSGAASDGSQGLKAIHRAGGAVFAQDPEQAAHQSMPRSAIETGLVDFVLPVEKMPRELCAYMKHPALHGARKIAGGQTEKIDRALPGILRSLRSQTGQDFAQYKKSTIRRRVQRRMAIQHIESFEDYAHCVQNNSAEADVLFRDLLINVTSFFRDPEAFAELKTAVAERIDRLEAGQELRIWCPGCATGEEAYSIAILLHELFAVKEIEVPTRIFATDLNAKAIDYAREALYPENISADLSQKQLDKFFQKKGGRYKVDSRLREMVIFAVHNLTSAPPFSRLDLVICRNLLIYLDASLQKNIIPLLHYSLKTGGLLFLGKSENIGDFTNLFAPVNKAARIFRARKADSEAILHRVGLPTSSRGQETMEEAKVKKDQQAQQQSSSKAEKNASAAAVPSSATNPPDRASEMRGLVERTYIERYAPPGVLVDSENEVRYFHGDTGRYLSPPQGEPSFELKRMVLGDFQHQILEILDQARQANQRVVRRDVPAGIFDDSSHVDLVATPVFSKEGPYKLTLLTFEEKDAGKKSRKIDTRITTLERELLSTRQELQATIEELESSNEELQSANEELQANNEELQNANEELETSREELQSTNEELEVLNAELEKKNKALIQAKDDVTNLFNATGEGTVILDTEMKIKRFTPAMTRYFKLIDSDIGRPVTDISSTLRYDELDQDVRQVLDRLEAKTREIQTRDGHWVQVRIQPYRTSDNVISGAVVTCTDLTRLKKSELQARQAQRISEAIIETTREPLLILSGELRIVSANRAFYRTFDLSASQTIDRRIYEIDGGSFDLPELRHLLEEIIPERREIQDYAIESGRDLLLNARRMVVEDGDEEKILISFSQRK